MQLKKESEEKYKIHLKEYTDDFLKYPNFIDDGEYKDKKFNYNSEYFRHVLIYSESVDSYLGIDNNKIILTKSKDYIWDATLLNEEITLRYKDYYLGFKDGVSADPLMNLWKFSKSDDNYSMRKPESNEYLSVKDNTISLTQCEPQEYEKFKLINFYE